MLTAPARHLRITAQECRHFDKFTKTTYLSSVHNVKKKSAASELWNQNKRCLWPPARLVSTRSAKHSSARLFDYHPEHSRSRGGVINCGGGDQCLRSGERLLIVPAPWCCSLQKIPSHLHDEWRPFWRGRLVFGIRVDWELRAITCERGAPGTTVLPRWKGGAINQPV